MGSPRRALLVASVALAGVGLLASPGAPAPAVPDARVEITAATARWHLFGEPVRVAVTIANRGPEIADAELAIGLGIGVAFDGLEPVGIPCAGRRVVVCKLGTLAEGEVRSLELRVRARRPVLYTHVEAAVGTAEDPEAARSSARFSVCSHLGTPAPDVLRGTSGHDVICARGGDDTIRGGGGGDHVDAGGGHDRIVLGGGRNVVFARRGRDAVRGGTGRDAVDAGSGRDRVAGLAGPDVLLGEAGDDVLLGGPGDDEITGSTGRDRLEGGRGEDMLDARDGTRDVVDGGRGRDLASVDRVDRLTSARRGDFVLGWPGFR